MKGTPFNSWVGKICWKRDRLPTPVFLGFSCGSAGKESACNVGDLSSIPWLGRSPGEGKGYPLQYSGLENSMDWGSMGSQRVRHDWATFTFTHIHICIHIHTHTYVFFSIMVYHKSLDIVPCTIRQDLVVYLSYRWQFVSSSPNDQSNPPLPPSPWQPQVYALCLWVCFCWDSIYKW